MNKYTFWHFVKRRPFYTFTGLLIFLFAAGELISRVYIGLGDPPLSIRHPKIEYMFAPSQDCQRFGNQFSTNSYGMRSADFPPFKSRQEVRILVLGDSVINGGSLTDQEELATELLRNSLSESLPIPVVVGNISAGSWSPPNLEAYIDDFGTFDADVAFIVLNKGDLYDFPTFSELNPETHPYKKPSSALIELIHHYLLPKASEALGLDHEEKQNSVDSNSGNREDCIDELRSLVIELKSNDIEVYLLYHPSKNEIRENKQFAPKKGYFLLEEFCAAQGFDLYSLSGWYISSLRSGNSVFRDIYHPNEMGQKLMYRKMKSILQENGRISNWQEKSF